MTVCITFVSLALMVTTASFAADASPASIESLKAESLVKSKVRLTGVDVRVKELIGRYKLDMSQGENEGLMKFIERHKEAFGIADPRTELEWTKTDKKDGHDHVVFQQLYKGIPVWRKTVEMDVSPDGSLEITVSRYFPVGPLDTTPKLSREDALAAAGREWKKQRGEELPDCGSELVIFKHKLAYNLKVPAAGDVYLLIVDATDGKLLYAERAIKDTALNCH